MIDDKLHVSRKKDLLQAYRICLSVRPYSRQFYMTLNMKGGDINQNFIMRKTPNTWFMTLATSSPSETLDMYPLFSCHYVLLLYRASCTFANFRHLLLLLPGARGCIT